MLPAYPTLKAHLKNIIADRRAQGHVVDGLHEELNSLPDSYDALDAFAHKLSQLPVRADWKYVEPEELGEIWSECDPSRPLGQISPITTSDAAQRVETAFLSSLCGCILGKPLEFNPTLEELRENFEPRNEWPLRDYISDTVTITRKEAEKKVFKLQGDCCRENIRYVAADDDINYTILGMINLEENGAAFGPDNLRQLWLKHQSAMMTWGPERMILVRCGLHHLAEGLPVTPDYREWVNVWNRKDELCGALIRADAYGYACPGRPALAAELAYRDASFTHRKTGVYGTMFVAAAIAAAFVAKDPLQIFECALKFVPKRSRFYQIASDSLNEVSHATDWMDGYNRIHGKYKEYSHCQVYQECGTLINTLRFATSIDNGFCMQVCQGNDTDSFGATSGSILGAYFGPGHLDPRWLAPFQDDIHTGLNFFYERSISALARRMGELPARIGLAANA